MNIEQPNELIKQICSYMSAPDDEFPAETGNDEEDDRILEEFIKEKYPLIDCEGCFKGMAIDLNNALCYINHPQAELMSNVLLCSVFNWEGCDHRLLEKIWNVLKDDPLATIEV